MDSEMKTAILLFQIKGDFENGHPLIREWLSELPEGDYKRKLNKTLVRVRREVENSRQRITDMMRVKVKRDKFDTDGFINAIRRLK